MKKQKSKKAAAASTAASKKEEKPAPDAQASTAAGELVDGKEGAKDGQVEEKVEEELAGQRQDNVSAAKDVEDASSKSTAEERPSHSRQPSLTLQSRMRSDSFRRMSISAQAGSVSPTVLKSPPLPPMSPGSEPMQDLYRKQALRIDELEKENRRLEKAAQDADARWKRLEEELEAARESNSEVAALKEKGREADSKAEEVERLVRSPVSV